MNRLYLTFVTSILFFTGIASAHAATFTGVIKGAQCHIQGNKCPASKSDPHLVLENDFVLVSGSDYYFLTNLPRNEKLNIYNQSVSIEGNVSNMKIEVKKVIRKEGKKEQTIWDQAEIDAELAELYDS